MKKLIILITISCWISSCLYSQDLIILKNGNEVKSKVLEITPSEVRYKKFDNPDGPTISIMKSEVSRIRYQNGTEDVITTPQAGVSQSENRGKENYSDAKPNRFGIYVNPLGLIEFGLMGGTEITLSSKLIIDTHVRISSLGLLMYVLTADDEEGWPDKISGMGIGGGIKYLAPSHIGGFYVGALFEYGFQTQYYAEDENWYWKNWVKYVMPMASVGYKFRFDSGFFINAGLLAGAAITTEAHWQYLKNYKNDSIIHEDDLEVHPFGMLEVGLGIEF